MSRTGFAILMVSVTAVILIAMLIAWRGRIRREPGIENGGAVPTGEVIVSFPRVSYVSTTPTGSPFERAAIPGLSYKGYAELTVQRDAVTIAVTGEKPVYIAADDVIGTATAGGRVGKFVERDGLSLLVWRATATETAKQPSRELESSFRFADVSEQQTFTDAIAEILHAANETSSNTTQEDA